MSRSLRALFLTAALLSPVASAPALAAESSALEQAYQKEFAYLAAEKRALQERLAAHQAEARQRASAAEGRVQGLEVRLLTLERQGDALEKRLEDYDEAVTALAEARDLLDGTSLQAKESLGLDLADNLSDAQRLDSIFKAAVGNLDKASEVRVEPGAFFLPDGTRVQGEIVRLGEIAAYGVAPGGVGSLLPVGEGRMQLRLGGGGEAEAKALAAGNPPDTIGAFLFESADKPVTERTEQTFADYMRGGGIVGWVIVLLGAVALALGALRMGALALAGRGQALADKVNAKVAEGDLAGAIEAAKGKLPVLRIQQAVLASPSRDREVLHDIAAEALLRETPAVERYNAVILVVAAVAPLLGLLGTVTGMISTFEIITEFGTGDPKMLSSGISEALITTQLGLVVAIPGVLIGNAVKGRADAVLGGFEQAVLRLVNLLQDGPDGESDDREDSEERPIGPRVVNG